MTADLDDPAPATLGGAGSSPRRRTGAFVVPLGVALLLTLAVRAFLVESVYVPSAAMGPQVPAASRVLVVKPGVQPVAGEVVVADISRVFGLAQRSTPYADGAIGSAMSSLASVVGVSGESQAIVSRVVAVGGDVVSVTAGTVSVNGRPVREGLIGADVAEFTVPSGHVWLLGDDHARAIDSLTVAATAAGSGSVPVDSVVGRVAVTFWPLSQVGLVDSTLPGGGR
ncbi:MAG: signal peptidase I [Phycicoccus sp.]|nr:signal peptidase I [Phycicoccus sp.]